MDKIDRYEIVQHLVYEKTKNLSDDQQRNSILHLSGVAVLSGLIAMKRGLNVEVCKTAGILHDLWLYCNIPLDAGQYEKHCEYGSIMAKELLTKINMYKPDEIDLICRMILNHGNKNEIGNVYDEVLKDADSLQHFINNSEYDKKYNYYGRNKTILNEFGIKT